MEFKEILKDVREKAGDSMKSLGEKMGLSANYISLIENGKRPASKEFLEKLITVYSEEKDLILDTYYMENIPSFIIEQIRNNKVKDMLLERIEKKQDFSEIYSEFFEKLNIEDQKIALKILVERMKENEIKKNNYDKTKLEEINKKIDTIKGWWNVFWKGTWNCYFKKIWN